jgi:hypothetical protein
MATRALGRWDDKRLTTYSAFANAVKNMVRLCRRIAETRGLLPRESPSTSKPRSPTSPKATQRALKWETVLLLGDPTTISAARTWYEQAWRLEQILREDRPDQSSFINAQGLQIINTPS